VKHVARVFRSLADETRLSMLCLLMQQEELCVCDFMEVLEITQSKASRHICITPVGSMTGGKASR
jgi:ArsR family transcriptional regulator